MWSIECTERGLARPHANHDEVAFAFRRYMRHPFTNNGIFRSYLAESTRSHSEFGS